MQEREYNKGDTGAKYLCVGNNHLKPVYIYLAKNACIALFK